MNYQKPEIEQWIPVASKIWNAPIDVSVKISASTSFHLISAVIFHMIPTDDFFDGIVTWVAQAASVASPLYIDQSHRKS
jgi:hypothetical protein